MPGTCAERTQQYIERLKISGKYEKLKKKKAESEKLRRQRLKESLNRLSECKRKKFVDNVRAKCRERVKRFREKSKQSNAQLTTLQSNRNNGPASLLAPQRNFLQSSYKTEAALAKATTKFRKSLPKSPSKKDAIIEKFVNSLRNHENVVQNKAKLNKGGRKGIAEELCTEILHFYERDDVSRISANTKDARFYKNPETGRKELKQKRYLVLTLKQAHNKFLIENAEQYPDKVPVKLAKFGALRPAHVKLVHATPQAVCLCIYHENFEQCCSVLNKHLPLFPAYGPELKRLLTCDDQKRDCWFKSCDICNAKTVEKKIQALMKGKEKKKISWWQWEKDETTNRTEKKQITGTVKKLIDYFVSVYKSFLIHSFINRQQHENFAEDLKYVNLHDDECLVQCDFAENWTNESQDEVSNAHWNQKQISLFTISLRYGCKQYSKVAVSDNLDHSKDTIFAYLYKTMSMVPKYIKRIRLWTDGPSNQFKNKYMAATIKAFETKFHKKIIWNYHATAHGKSCVDGIGAVVKNKIKRLVNSRKSVVNCSRDFIDSFNQEPSNIELIEMSFADINKINKTMKLDTVTETAKTIKDISKFHQLQCVDNKIKGFVLSKDGYASLQ